MLRTKRFGTKDKLIWLKYFIAANKTKRYWILNNMLNSALWFVKGALLDLKTSKRLNKIVIKKIEQNKNVKFNTPGCECICSHYFYNHSEISTYFQTGMILSTLNENPCNLGFGTIWHQPLTLSNPPILTLLSNKFLHSQPWREFAPS